MRGKCVSIKSRLQQASSAPDASANGHKGAKGAARLEHHLAHVIHELTPSQPIPQSSEAPKEGPCCHAHREAHHEAQFDPVPAAGPLPLLIVVSCWHSWHCGSHGLVLRRGGGEERHVAHKHTHTFRPAVPAPSRPRPASGKHTLGTQVITGIQSHTQPVKQPRITIKIKI